MISNNLPTLDKWLSQQIPLKLVWQRMSYKNLPHIWLHLSVQGPLLDQQKLSIWWTWLAAHTHLYAVFFHTKDINTLNIFIPFLFHVKLYLFKC